MSVVDAQQRARTPTNEAIQRFLRYTARFAKNTQNRYRDSLWRFFDDMPPFLEQITPEHIDRHIGSLKMSNNSKNTVLVPIKSFFTYLHEYHGLPNVAAKVKNLPSQPPKQRVITEIEYSKLLKIAKPREGAVIRFLANTGLRSQEFCDLTPQSVSSDEKYITIIGKAQKRRIVPLNDTCRKCMPAIFEKKYNRDKLSWLCRKLSQKAKIPRFGPHALRHRAITELIKRGVPIAIVSKIAGHSSPEITFKIYCHLFVPDFLGTTDVLDS